MIDFALQASGEDAEDAVKAEELGFVAYVREPIHIAADVATLDVISNGRAM